MQKILKLALAYLKANQDDELVQDEMESAGITSQQLEEAVEELGQLEQTTAQLEAALGVRNSIVSLFHEAWSMGMQVEVESPEGTLFEILDVFVSVDDDRLADIETGGGELYDENGVPRHTRYQGTEPNQGEIQ